jgi:2-amino-4-hydroxy-6-hydroxymethyldihydropteridine diphosphokinase
MNSAPLSVAIALGSNLGDRRYWLNRAVSELRNYVDVVRVSRYVETEPVDAPAGSDRFLNAVIVGSTRRSPDELLQAVRDVESLLGRRRGVRNAPRNIDIDIILFSAVMRRSEPLTLPHPRFHEREFVLAPLRELRMAWNDPRSGARLD